MSVFDSTTMKLVRSVFESHSSPPGHLHAVGFLSSLHDINFPSNMNSRALNLFRRFHPDVYHIIPLEQFFSRLDTLLNIHKHVFLYQIYNTRDIAINNNSNNNNNKQTMSPTAKSHGSRLSFSAYDGNGTPKSPKDYYAHRQHQQQFSSTPTTMTTGPALATTPLTSTPLFGMPMSTTSNENILALDENTETQKKPIAHEQTRRKIFPDGVRSSLFQNQNHIFEEEHLSFEVFVDAMSNPLIVLKLMPNFFVALAYSVPYTPDTTIAFVQSHNIQAQQNKEVVDSIFPLAVDRRKRHRAKPNLA